jgi:hypothetical protein
MQQNQITLEALPGLFVQFTKQFQEFAENQSAPKNEIESPIDVEEAREFLKLDNIQTIYRLVRRGELPSHKKIAASIFSSLN